MLYRFSVAFYVLKAFLLVSAKMDQNCWVLTVFGCIFYLSLYGLMLQIFRSNLFPYLREVDVRELAVR